MKESKEVVPLQSGAHKTRFLLLMASIDGAAEHRAASQHLLRIDYLEIAVESAVPDFRIGYDKLKSRRVNLICKAGTRKCDVCFAYSLAQIYFGQYAFGVGH